MKSHTRQTDEELLMQFAEEQGRGEPGLMESVDRLRNCHKDGLHDYSIPSNDGEQPPTTMVRAPGGVKL